MLPVLLSNKRPARIASTRGGDGQGSTPPSRPMHGGGPAPRQGTVIGLGCAKTVAALKNRMITGAVDDRFCIAHLRLVGKSKIGFRLSRNLFGNLKLRESRETRRRDYRADVAGHAGAG